MTDGHFRGARRRKFLRDAAAAGGVAAAAAWLPSVALAQAAKLKVGLMLPYIFLHPKQILIKCGG